VVKIIANSSPQSLSVGLAGTLPGSVCGVNKYGIAYAGDSIHLGNKIGIPLNFILRKILEAKNLKEAIAVVLTKQRSLAQNTVIVSANEKRIISVESAFEKDDVLTTQRPYLVHTNHLLSPKLETKKEDSSIDSRIKYINADFLLARRRGRMDVEFLKDVLEAPKVFVKNILFGRDQTIASIVMDAGKQVLMIKNTYDRKNYYYSYNLIEPLVVKPKEISKPTEKPKELSKPAEIIVKEAVKPVDKAIKEVIKTEEKIIKTENPRA
jgi:hypothetical protein